MIFYLTKYTVWLISFLIINFSFANFNIGLLNNEDFLKSKDKFLSVNHPVKDMIIYRLALIKAQEKSYAESLNYLKTIEQKLIMHNLDLITDIYDLLDEKYAKELVLLLKERDFFTPYHSNHEFFDIANRNKISKLYGLILTLNVLDEKTSLSILTQLFKTIPESTEYSVLENSSYFSKFINNITFADYLERINKLINFGANTKAFATIEYLKNSSLKLDNAQQCELQYQEAKAQRKRKNFDQANSLLQKITSICPQEVLIKRDFLQLSIAMIQKNASLLELFDEFVKKYPTSSLSDDVLLFKTQVLLDSQKEEEALVALERIIKEYPKGDMIHQAVFLKAFLLAKNNQTAKSIENLHYLQKISPKNSLEYAQATYWIARFQIFPSLNTIAKEQKTKEALSAIISLKNLASEKIGTIYSTLSYALLKHIKQPVSRPIWKKANLNKLNVLEKNLSTDEKFILDLIKYKFKKEALSILKQQKIPSKDYNKLVNTAYLYKEMNMIEQGYVQLIAANFHGDIYLQKEYADIYPFIAYPKPFAQEVKQALNKYAVEESFLYAIMRQEGFFVPQAVSWAGALGLCQLTYPTALEYAKKNNITLKDQKDLFDPKLNLLLGANVIFDYSNKLKNPLLGLAGYNAGVYAVNIWQKKYEPKFVDYFIEQIPQPYKETRNYLKKVIANMWNYDSLYDSKKELFFNFVL